MRLMIFKVVATPTSEEIRISSRLSRTSSSTFDLPTRARVILEKKDCLVFSKPTSNVSFLEREKKSNRPIMRKKKPPKGSLKLY